MASGAPEQTVELVCIDPERGVWRYYVLSLELDLFAPVRLCRRWGRLGSRGTGQSRVEVFADRASAERRLAAYYRTRLRRGYTERAVDPRLRAVLKGNR